MGEEDLVSKRRVSSSVALPFLLLAFSTSALGCFTLREAEGKASAPVPLKVAVADLEDNLNRMGVLVLSDARFKNSDRPEDVASIQRIKDVIADAQCYDWAPNLDKNGKPKLDKDGHVMWTPDPRLRTKNPLLPVINGAIQVQVQGQFSEAGTFSVTASATQGAGVSGGGTLTRQTQQQVMLPVSLVSLANLENFYIGQQLANLQQLTLTKSPPFDNPSTANSLVTDVLVVGENIKAIVCDAMKNFSENAAVYCQGHGLRHSELIPPGSAGFEFEDQLR